MLLAPAVAILPGTATALVATAALALGLDGLLAAVLAIGTLALVTRGLHLDGLADTADGLTASYDRARALEVMRLGDVGPAGVATVVLVLLVQVTALAQALPVAGPVAALVAVVAGRLAIPLVCARGVPAARPQGLGAAMAGSVPRSAAAAAGLLTAAAGAGLTAFAASSGVLWGLLFGAAAVSGSALVAGLLTVRAVRRFGGVTGDVLGACVEAGTAAALVILAATPS
jgi:adenosylcobinamide-GDP ribazoletransferase